MAPRKSPAKARSRATKKTKKPPAAPSNQSSSNSLQLVLASQSEARKRLLEKFGHAFECRPAYLDEEAYQAKIKDPSKLVRVLAIEKARAIAKERPAAVVIGSDQMLVLGKIVFGKPMTIECAENQLTKVSGRFVRLLTAVCVKSSKGESTFVHVTRLKFRNLTREQIADYVRLDRPLECAGSFKFESYGIALLEKVATDDPTAIEGLPLLKLIKILEKHDFSGPRFGR